MILRLTLAALVAAVTGTAFAGADDYVFEPVKSEIKSSNVATVAVRLVHKSTGKPVADAAIVQTHAPRHGSRWHGRHGDGNRSAAKPRTRRVRL
jgi:hypothetical protein